MIQRDLVDKFLAMYLPMVAALHRGHHLAVAADGDPLPELDFGPLISATKVAEFKEKVDKALRWGAVPIYRGSLDPSRFIEGQDTAAYQAPVALLAPPGASRLMREEPSGPVDTIVVVDTEAELLAKMNASNGALVASIACDDAELARELAEHSAGAARHGRRVRRRPHLMQAVTQGPPGERFYGNVPGDSRTPDTT